MTVELEWLESLGPAVAEEAAALMRQSFPMTAGFGPAEILATTISPLAGKPTIALAAREGGRLVGFNGFIPFGLARGADRAIAYQSCWSATHPDVQGRGIWVSMMQAAERKLAPEALFICGIPNPNSHPIMVAKLGYREIPLMHAVLPAVPGIAARFMRARRLAPPRGWLPDEPAIAAAKRLGLRLVEARARGGYAWGKADPARWKRLPVTMLKVGGIAPGDDPAALPALVDALAGNRASVLQFIMAQSHELAPAFRNLAALTGVRPFVVRDLQTAPGDPVNIMFGMTDVF